MIRPIRRMLYPAAVIILPLAFGAIRLRAFSARELRPPRRAAYSASAIVEANAPRLSPPFDSTKPTVVVLLGADVTEVTDALATPSHPGLSAGGSS